VGSWVVESPDEPRKFIKEKGRGNFPQVESPRKLGKGFGIACQSVIRASKRIQNPPQQQTPKLLECQRDKQVNLGILNYSSYIYIYQQWNQLFTVEITIKTIK
jgi:hypothetical protein